MESKPELTPSFKTSHRRLKGVPPIIITGKGRITTEVAGHKDDDFGVTNPSTKEPADLNAHERETAYALQDRTDVPPKLAKGLRINRCIGRRKQKDRSERTKPAIYAPFENPPEVE